MLQVIGQMLKYSVCFLAQNREQKMNISHSFNLPWQMALCDGRLIYPFEDTWHVAKLFHLTETGFRMEKSGTLAGQSPMSLPVK